MSKAVSTARNPKRTLQGRIAIAVLSTLAGVPMRWIRSSWRVDATVVHPEAQALLDSQDAVIYGLWHGRMYSLFMSVPLDRTAILVSPSNDGEFITRVARKVGFRHFVRGSKKRGGMHAIMSLKRELCERNNSIAFTVDGPRGPRYEVKSGIIRLAAQTGRPIIPLGASSKILLKKFDRAWDHFHAPLPFTGMRIGYGKPIVVPEGLSSDEAALEPYRLALEEELMRLNMELDRQYGFTDRL